MGLVDLTVIDGENKPKDYKRKFATGLTYRQIKQRSLNMWAYIKNRHLRKYKKSDFKLIWLHIHQTTSQVVEGGKIREWVPRKSLRYFF